MSLAWREWVMEGQTLVKHRMERVGGYRNHDPVTRHVAIPCKKNLSEA